MDKPKFDIPTFDLPGDTEMALDISIKAVDIQKMLKGINPSKSQGPNSIHSRIYKELAEEI